MFKGKINILLTRLIRQLSLFVCLMMVMTGFAAEGRAAVIFDDRFTQTADTTLASHTPTNAGASWSVLIQNGSATMRATAATDDCQVNTGVDNDGVLYRANVTGGYQNVDYEASVVSVDGNLGDDWNWLAVRVQDANNMYAFRFNEDSGQLFKRTAGTYSTLGAATAGIADGSTVVLRVIGDALTVLDDGGSIVSLTDTDHTAAGTAGLGMGNIDETATDDMSAQILDTFSVTTYVRITGTVYTDEGSTTIGAGRTVSVSINGAAAAGGANTDAGGVYDIRGLSIAAGDVLTIYLDGAAEDAVTVTVADGTDMVIDLYRDYLKLRHDNGGSLTNAHLDTADNNGDADITAVYTVSGGALTAAAGIEVFVETGHTYVPGGDVTADTVDINGVFTVAGNTVTISGDWDATGGAFSFTTGTLIFNGGATTQNVISNSSPFNHVQIGTGSAGAVVVVADNMDINGNVTVLNGGATTWDVTNRTINAAGSVTLTNLDTFTTTGSTFIFDGTTTLTSNNLPFNNVELGTGAVGASLTTADNMEVNGNMTILNGGATTWDVSGDTITIATDLDLTNLDTFTTANSTFVFDGTTSLTSAGKAFNNIQIGTGAVGASLTPADNMDINGAVTVLNGGATTWDVTNRTINAAANVDLTNLDTFTVTGSTFVFDGTTSLTTAGYAFNNIQLGSATAGGSLTPADNMDINGTVTALNGGATTWDVTNRTVNAAGSVTLTNLDTFTTTGSTFIFDGTTTLTSNNLPFNNVELGTGAVGASLTTADNMEVNGNMTILNGGATTWDVSGDTITIATNLDLTNLDTFTVTTSTFVFDGTTALTSAGRAFNNIQIGTGAAGASLTSADNMDINGAVTVLNGGATTWDVTNRTINAAGSITLTNLDTFTTTASTFVFDGTTTLTSNNLPFNNVELGTGAVGASLTTADNMEVNGNMTILNGGATTWDVSGDTITIATNLDLTNLDTFTVTTSTFVFDGTTSLTSAGKAFNNIQIGTGAAGASLTPADNMDINGAVTVLNGGATTWDVTNRTINAAGSVTLTNLDTFTTTGSTFVFDGTTTLTSAGYAFNNIQLGTGSTGGSLTTADNMDINGTVTVLNGGATTWNVDSDTINVASTVTLTNLDTFTTTGSTFIFDGTTSLTSAGLAFNAVQIGTGAAGAALTAVDNMDINGAVTVLNGGATTWDVTSRAINAAGSMNLTNLDTFTVTGSTFVFDGTTSLTTAGYAFNNIQLGSATAGGSLTPADNMDINGTVTALNGGATTWDVTNRTINAAGSVTLTNLDTFTTTGSTFIFDGTTTLTSNNLPFNNVELGTGAVGASLTTADNMEVNGNMTILNGGATTWDVSGDTITIATNLDLTNLDTFTVTTSTFVFDGTTSLTSAGKAFNNIQIGTGAAGASLTPADNMDINGAVTVLNGGATTWDVTNRTINAAGSVTLTNLDTFTTTGSTFIFDGTTTLTSAGLAFNAIQIGTGAVGASVTAADNMDINGALTVLNGGATTFNVTSRTINVSNNVTLTNLDTFTTTGSTFVFDGTTALTSAGLAFNNIQLGSATAGGSLTPADTMDINGTVAVLNGGATTWDVTNRTINVANTVNLTNLDTFTVTGSTFIFDGGATARTVTSAGFAFNNFQIGSATAGASVTMGDNADINGTITVTNAAATTWNITSRTINAASTVNLTNLDTFTVTGSTFVFDGTTTLTSGGRAFNNIQIGTASVGASVTAADTMDINGAVTVQNGGATTWDVTSRTVNAAGSVTLTNLDTFTTTGSTFVFDGTTALTSAGYAFNNIQLGSATAGGSLTPADNMDINGTVTVLNGGATTWNVTSRTINVASTVTLTNLDTFTTTGSTFIFDGTTSLTSAGLAFNAIQIGTGAVGASLTAADNMDINGNVTVLNGGATTWNVTSRTVNAAANVDLTNLDTFTVTGSTFVFDGTTSLTTAGYAFNNIQLGSATAGGSLTPADNMDINGTVTALNGGATTWDVTNRTINAAGSVTLTNLDTFTTTGSTFVFDGTTTLTSNNLPFNNVELGTGAVGASLTTADNMEVNGNMTILNGGATTWDVSGDTITIATNLDLTNLDTFTVTTSTFVFDGTTSLTSAGKAFNNIQIGTGAAGASLTSADNMDINGAVTVLNGGATTWDVTNRTVNAAGSVTLTNLDTFTTTGSTFVFDGTSTLTSAGYAFNNIQLGSATAGGSLTTADNMDINGTVTVQNGGATTFNISDDTISVSNTVTLTNLDTFTVTNSTFVFDGTTALTSAGLAFNNIQIGTGAVGASVTAVDNMDINGNVTVQNGGATTWDVTSRTINAAGSVTLTNLDTFTVTASRFVFDGTIVQTVTNTVGGYFERVQISNTTNPVNLGSDLDLIGTLTIDPSATLDVTVGNYEINLFGGPQDWINNGLFIPQSATVTFSPAATGDMTIYGVTTFYNLSFDSILTGNVVLSDNLTVQNDLTMSLTDPASGVDADAAETHIIFVAGNVLSSSTGDMEADVTIDMTGTAVQTISQTGSGVFGDLTISNTTNEVSMLTNLMVADDITVNTSTVFDLDDNDVTGTGATAFTVDGTLELDGGQTFVSADPAFSAGAWAEYTATGGTQAIQDWTYTNVQINGAGGTFTMQTDESLSGQFMILDGTFDTTASDYDLTVAGSFRIFGGNFTANASTVTLNDNLYIADSPGLFTGGASTVVLNASFDVFNPEGTNGLSNVLQRDGVTTTLTGSFSIGNNGVFTTGDATSTIQTDGNARDLQFFGTSSIDNNGVDFNTAAPAGDLRVVYYGGARTTGGGDYNITPFLIALDDTATLMLGSSLTVGQFTFRGLNAGDVHTFDANGQTFNASSLTVGTTGFIDRYSTFNAGASVINIAADLTILPSDGSGDNTLNGQTSIITIGDDWSNSGAFTPGTSTVEFTGNNISLAGSTTFYNLIIEETSNDFADPIVTLTAGGTFVIEGTMRLNGLDANDRVTMRSSIPGVRWNISITSGTGNVDYLDVSDSEVVGTNDILGTNSLNTDNNDAGEGSPQWVFVFGGIIDITGTSDLPGGTMIRVAATGSFQNLPTTTTNMDGSWTISNVPGIAIDEIIHIWAEGVAETLETNAITLYDGSGNVTGMILATNVLVIGSDDNATVTLQDMDEFDNDDDEDMMFTANAGVLNVDAAGTYTDERIRILPGNTLVLASGEVLTARDVTIEGTLDTGGVVVINITNGDWSNSGTFVQANSTVTFITSSGNNLTFDGTTTFYDVSYFGDGTTTVTTGTFVSDNNLLLTAGTLDINDNTLTVNGTLAISGGQLFTGAGVATFGDAGADIVTITSGTLRIESDNIDGGDIVVNSSTWNNTGGTIEYTSNSSSTIFSLLEPYNNLILNNAGGTYTAANDIDVNGYFTLNAGTFDQNVSDLNVAGNFTLASGTTYTKAGATGTLTFDGDLYFADNNAVKQDLGRLFIGSSPDTTTLTTDMAATALTVDAGDALITDGYTVDVSGTVIIDGTLDARRGTGGASTIFSGGPWDMGSGVFTGNASTVVFDGSSGAMTFIVGSNSFYNLTVDDSNGGGDFTVSPNIDYEITGTLFVADGIYDANGFETTVLGNVDVDATLDLTSGTDGRATMYVGGSWDATGGTFINTNSTVIFTGTTPLLTITTAAQAFNNIMINDGLVGYWKLNETSSPAADSSGYGRKGTWSGNPTTVAASQLINFADPRSIDLDGTGDYITIPTVNLPGEFTFSTWVNLDDVTNPRMIIGEDSGTSGGGPKIGFSAGAFFIRIVSTSDTAVTAPAVGSWHHIAITRSSADVVRLYVNGSSSVLFGGAAQSGVFGFNRMGANGGDGSQELNGRLDEVRVYDRALSSTEILKLARGNMPGTADGTYTLQDTLEVNGTLTLNAGELNTGSNNDINIQGSWMNHGGVFTANAGSVYFDDGLGPDNILSGSQTFYVVEITGSPTLTLLDNLPVGATFTNSSGTLTYSTDTNIEPVSIVGQYINAGGTFSGNAARFRHDGNLTIQGGTYTAPTDVLEISGTFTHSGGTFNNSGSTVMFIGTLDTSQIDTTGGTIFNDVIINDGLVGYWKFDESASPAHDYSGYNAHGTWNGSTGSASVPAAIQFTDPRSASFIGGSYIRVTNHDAIDIGGTDITITAWINVVDNGSGGSDQVFVGKPYFDIGSFSSPYFQYDFEFDDNGANTFDFYFTSTAGVFQGPFSVTPTLGQWNHVAFTYDGANVRGYLNGANTSTTPETDEIVQRGRDLLFGVDGGLSQPFNGQMDDLRIYNRALSTTEIQALASGTTPQAGLGTVTLQTDLNVEGTLFINSGELDAGINRQINIAGSWFNHGGLFDEQTSTVEFDAQAGTVHILDMYTFYNLELDDAPGGGATFRQNSPLSVGGTLLINGGTLDASTDNHSINLAGDWVNNDTFMARSATVYLVGTVQSVTGSTTFYNLAKTETSNDATDSIVTFEAGITFNIGGSLRLQGLDDDDRINLLSSIPGTRFTFNVPSSKQRVRLLEVMDSQSSGNDIIARRTIEGTNVDTEEAPPHWIISPGDIYEWTGSADNATWANQGNWDFGDTTAGNDGYPDDNLEEAFILLSSDNITTPAGTLTIGGLLITSDFGGSLTLSGTLVADNASGLLGNVMISGGTLDHADNTNTEANKLVMLVDGGFLLAEGAQINVDRLGYDAGFGPGSPSGTDGGAYGGIGGDFEEDGTDSDVYGSIFAPVNIGSGGGVSGSGGGAVIMTVAGTTTIEGTISAEGEGTGLSSGAGGSIYLTTGYLEGTGTLSVNGGEDPVNRGGGGGGRLAIILTGAGADFSNFTGPTTAYGGDGWVNFSAGAAGTVYLETEAVASGTGTLIIDNDIDNKTLDVTRQVVTQMPAAVNLNNFAEIIIRNGGYLGIDANDTINFGAANLTTESTERAFITIIDDAGVTFPNPYVLADYTLNADGISTVNGDWTITTGALSHSQNGENEEFKINMTINGNLDVGPTGKVDVSGKGYEAGAGPGAPTLSPNGGGYGGIGGDHNMDGQDSATYGSITAPTDLGSGGGNGGGSGERAGAGGGAIILNVTGVTTIDGTMAAVGRDGGNHGSGSGGSIYLTTGSLAGTGAMTVDGGTGPVSRGGGGGGRLAVILTGSGADFDAFDLSGTMTAYGGERWAVDNAGAAGTIYRQTEPQGAGNGILIIDNNNNAFVSESTGVITTLDDRDANMTVVGSLVIDNGAYFEIGADDELTVGGTLSTLTIDVTGTLVNDGTLNLGGSVFNVADITDLDFDNIGNDVVYLGQDNNVTITPLNTVYYNIRFDNAGTSFAIGNDLDVNGSFNLDNGIFVQGNNDVNVAGNFTLAAGTTFTRPVTSGTLTFDGDLYFADNTSPLQNIGRLVIGQSPDTTTLTTDMSALSVTIMSGDVLVTDGYEITLTGTMDINGLLNAASGSDGNTTIDAGGLWDMTGGTFTNTNSTVLFSGTSVAQTFDIISDAKTFNNVTFDDDSGGTTWELEDNLDINGNLLLSDGTLDIKVSENNQINFAGNWTNTAGVLLARQGTVVFDRTSGTAVMTPADQTFYNFVVNGSSNPTLQLAGTLDLSGSLSILDGALDLDGHEMNVSGNVYMNDVLDASSGTDGNATIMAGRNWDMTGGTFTNTNSTVMFVGTLNTSTITSNTRSFNNMIINDGLAGYWKLDETSSPARDDSGYANHGVWAGPPAATTTTPPKINFANARALDFDGSNDYLSMPPITTPARGSMAVWLRPDSVGGGTIRRIWSNNDNFEFLIDASALFVADVCGSGTATAGSAISSGQWYHTVVTWDDPANIVNIYVNGTQVDAGNVAIACGQTGDLLFGWRTGVATTQRFDGLMDDIRYYNRVLSLSEIQALANGNMPGTALGTYTLQDNLDVNGTLTLNAGELHTGTSRDINIGRSWMNHGGIFTATSGDVFFDGTSSLGLILSGSQTFYNVDITGSGVWTLQDNAPASSVFDVSAGTLTYSTNTVIEPVSIVGNATVTGGTFTGQPTRFRHEGNISISSGVYTAPTDVLEVTGSFAHTGGTFNNAGSTVMFTGTEAQTIDTSGGAAFQDVIVNDGLMAYWKFDEASSPAVDYSGYGNNGVWNGNVSASSSVSGRIKFADQQSLNFDGTDDYIAVQNSDSLDIGGTKMTIAMWVFADDLTRDQILVRKLYNPSGASNPTSHYNVEFAGAVADTFDFFFTDTSGTKRGPFQVTPTLGQWNHIAFTYDGTNVRGYINGNNTSTTGETTSIAQRGQILRIGTDHNLSQDFDGRLDEIRIYNRPLSAPEVAALADGNMPGASLGTYTLQTNLNIDGTLRLNTGTLDVGSNRQINIAGDWENFGGVFAEQAGIVILDGTDQQIPASETFYNFTKTLSASPSRTLTFGRKSTVTISNTLTLQGFDSSSKLNLRSSSVGSRFNVDVPAGPQSVTHIDVRDSEALSNNIRTSNSTDSGNTDTNEPSPRWVFGPLRGAVMMVD